MAKLMDPHGTNRIIERQIKELRNFRGEDRIARPLEPSSQARRPVLGLAKSELASLGRRLAFVRPQAPPSTSGAHPTARAETARMDDR